jgi:signal transduction histidine kinase
MQPGQSSHAIRRALVQALVVLVLFYLAAQVGETFSGKGILTPVWPPAAVAQAAAILFGVHSLLPSVLYVAWDFLTSGPAERAQWAWIEPSGVLLSALLVRLAARHAGFDAGLGSLRAIVVFLGLCFVYSTVNSLVITAGYCELAHFPSCARVGRPAYFWQAFIGDFFGSIVCLPALLGWLARDWERGVLPRFSLPQAAEWRFIAAGLLAACAAWGVSRADFLPVDVIGFLLIPLLVWAALQYRARFVHTVIMVAALVAVTLQLHSGTVDFQDPGQHLASLLMFLLTLSLLTLIVHAVSQQQQARAGEHATARERERIELMLQSASDAVLSFDATGSISYRNPAAARLFGAERTTPGARIEALLPDARVQRVVCAPAQTGAASLDALLDGPPIELTLRDAEGNTRTLEVALTSYRTEGEWHASAFLHDVTARRRAEEEIRASLARQEELNKLRSQFVAVTSHEFRTPLATILSSAEILERYAERLPAGEKTELFASIARSVERMTRMIERVLFIGRTDAELLDFSPREIDLAALCREVAAEVQQEWPAALPVALELPSALSGNYDDKLLRHVLGNLLANAIKYSPGAALPVRLAARVNGAGAEIVVEDHGIGIPPADLPHLFEPFQRGANVGSIPGTGLGLSIVRRAVELHGGRIEVDSAPGRGTRFTIRL